MLSSDCTAPRYSPVNDDASFSHAYGLHQKALGDRLRAGNHEVPAEVVEHVHLADRGDLFPHEVRTNSRRFRLCSPARDCGISSSKCQ